MKYLLDKNLVVIARGESLEGNKDELVYDPEGKQTLKELRAIAKANTIAHDNKTKLADLAALITDVFSQLDLPEKLDIKGIVVAGVKAGKDDNQIMMELIDAGIPVRDAVGEFRIALMAAGMLLKPKERNAKLAELLDDFEPETGDDVSAKLRELMDAVPRTTERQAMAAIRKYARDNKLELPKVKRVGGFKKKVYDWMIAHPTATVDELGAFIAEKGKPESVAKRYGEVLTLAQRMAERIVAG